MSFRVLSVLVLSLAVLAVGLGDSVRAGNLLTNGDFEAEWADPAPPGWAILYNATVTPQTSPVIGGDVSAHLDGTDTSDMDMLQVPSASPSYWCFDVDFASDDPGIDKRSFYIQLRHKATDSHYIMFKVEGDGSGAGDLYAYGGGYEGSSEPTKAWHAVASLDDAVSFSTDVASDPLNVNHLQVIGHYNDDSPTYDIHLTDAGDTTRSALGMTIWRDSTPEVGDGIVSVKFLTKEDHSNGDYLIDNVELVNLGTYVPGDADENGEVDAADAAILAAHWLQAGDWGDGDFNEDGIVNDVDATMMAANWHYGVSASAAVPEPGTLALLALLGLSVLALRRGNKLTRRDK